MACLSQKIPRRAIRTTLRRSRTALSHCNRAPSSSPMRASSAASAITWENLRTSRHSISRRAGARCRIRRCYPASIFPRATASTTGTTTTSRPFHVKTFRPTPPTGISCPRTLPYGMSCDDIRVGEVVHLEGKLVDIESPQFGVMRTSLTRNDTGPGACEIIYVEAVSLSGG